MQKLFSIKGRKISDKQPPLVVGEVSANHSNSLKKIFKIIDCAAEIKLEAIKFQTFDLDNMTFNINKKEFLLRKYFKNKKWNNRSLYSLYKEAQLPLEWHKQIFKRAEKKGLICFSSVFDVAALKILQNLNCPAYKIASLESLHYPLIEKVSKLRKPLIISTGTLSFNEILNLISFLKKIKSKFALLHCLTQYPGEIKNCNLKTISYLKENYSFPVGYSDHTKGSLAALSAVSLGSNIIEKHFMLKEGERSLDSDFSFGPKRMEKLIIDSKEIWKSLGKVKKNITYDERFYRRFRRSIYISENILPGTKINHKNIKIIRPGKGLEPKYYDKILGKKAKVKLSKGEPLKWSHLK